MFKRNNGIKAYIKSDLLLRYDTCWYGKDEKIEGFYFMSKSPMSKSYQWHAVLGLDMTYRILGLIQKGIKHKSKLVTLSIRGGMGVETVKIWRGSFKKAETQILTMIKEIQRQY